MMLMSVKAKIIAAIIGILLIIVSVFLYFTIRFKYIEQEYIASLITITNEVVGSYQSLGESMRKTNGQLSPGDLPEYLKLIHRRYGDIALLAITDRSRSVRVSSKNDTYIRSADLYEEILKDFTQERLNITKSKPYLIRYYDEKTGAGVRQHKFYIFMGKIGPYRLLIAYPYHLGAKILLRTGVELFLIALIVIVTAASVYLLYAKKSARAEKAERDAVETGEDKGIVTQDRHESKEQSGYPGLPGIVFELFRKIYLSSDADCISLYISRGSETLVKTMELTGESFKYDDSIGVEEIDINNETGIELRKSIPLVLDQGRRLVLPLVYENIFLGTVNIERQNPIRGEEMRRIFSDIQGIRKQLHDSSLMP